MQVQRFLSQCIQLAEDVAEKDVVEKDVVEEDVVEEEEEDRGDVCSSASLVSLAKALIVVFRCRNVMVAASIAFCNVGMYNFNVFEDGYKRLK